jgi:hypothetical protein
MTATAQFEKWAKWAKGFAGCSGGDMGSPDNRTIWVCGIEWGAAPNADELKNYLQCDVSQPPEGDEYTDEHLKDYWRSTYNQNTQKILSAINGGKTIHQKEFYESVRPFTKGSKGYFKLNFLPISFPSVNAAWLEEFKEITGFGSKDEYIKWCRENRAPQMRAWARTARPRMILCSGKMLQEEFKKAFHDEDNAFKNEPIAGRDLWWSVNAEGTLVVIIPFLAGRYGVSGNDRIQQFGEKIAQLMQQHGCR